MSFDIISQLAALATHLAELGEEQKAHEVDDIAKDAVKDDQQILDFIKLHYSPPKEITIDHMPVYMTDEEFDQLDAAEKQAILDEAKHIAASSKITPVPHGAQQIYFVEVPYHAEPDSPESLFYAVCHKFGFGGSIIRLHPDHQGGHLRYVVYSVSLT